MINLYHTCNSWMEEQNKKIEYLASNLGYISKWHNDDSCCSYAMNWYLYFGIYRQTDQGTDI